MHHDTLKYFPYGKSPSYPGAWPRWSTHSQILPYLEQGNLYKLLDFTQPPWVGQDSSNGCDNPTYPINAACHTALKVFYCPSESSSEQMAGNTSSAGVTFPGSNYCGNQGTAFMCDLGDTTPSTVVPTLAPNGVFYNMSKVTIAGITDGTSNTAMMSEHRRSPGHFDAKVSMFDIQLQTTLDDTHNACQGLDPLTTPTICDSYADCWAWGETCCTIYNHVSTPNGRTCGAIPFPGAQVNMSMDVPASSNHSGGE
jgi:hypothetical protein